MSLLADVIDTALDPGYHRAAEAGPRRVGWRVVAVVVVIGLLLGLAAQQNAASRSQRADERTALLAQLKRTEAHHQALQTQMEDLSARIATERDQALGQGEAADATRTTLADLAVATGTSAVTGDGITITIDDASDASNAKGRVLDVDLRQVVNGLWQAGAEAITVNGQRLTPTTSIRTAGDAITVNYRSLAHPYKIQAIGDPRQLPGRFAATPGGQWLAFLRTNYGVKASSVTSKDMALPAAPEPELRNAARKER